MSFKPHAILYVPGAGLCTSSLTSPPLTLYDLNTAERYQGSCYEPRRSQPEQHHSSQQPPGGEESKEAHLNGGAQNRMPLRLLRLREVCLLCSRVSIRGFLGRILLRCTLALRIYVYVGRRTHPRMCTKLTPNYP